MLATEKYSSGLECVVVRNAGGNCGTGAGGFAPGNTCAKGGEGAVDEKGLFAVTADKNWETFAAEANDSITHGLAYGSVMKKVDRFLAFAQEFEAVSPERAEEYRQAMRGALKPMSAIALDILAKSIKEIRFFPDKASLQARLVNDEAMRNKNLTRDQLEKRLKGVSGAAGDDGIVYLDGDAGYASRGMQSGGGKAMDIYKHELSHMLDFGLRTVATEPDDIGLELSKREAWQRSWGKEIVPDVMGNDGKETYRLTRYAAKTDVEGWAEFGRLAYTKPETAKRDFPKCWAVWKGYGLVR